MEWTIQDLGAAGEFVSSVAVLVTLIYLSVQMKHAREDQRRSVLDERTNGIREHHLSVATNPSLAAALTTAHQAASSAQPVVKTLMSLGLTSEQAMQVSSYLMSQFRLNLTQHETIKDARQMKSHDANLVTLYRDGLGRVFWDSIRTAFRAREPGFIDHVDELLRNSDARGADPL